MSKILATRDLYICGETKEVKNVRETFICVDIDGFYIKTTLDKIKNRLGLKFSRYSKSNPFSVKNINRNGELQGFKSRCIDVKFDSKSDLKFECQCGKTFDTNYYAFISGKTTLCNKCTNSHQGLSFEELKSDLSDKGYHLIISKDNYKGVTLTPLICKDDLGYKYQVVYNMIMQNKKAEIFHRCNPFSLDNIKNYLIINNMPYECLSTKFESCRKDLIFKCKRCGELIKKAWRDINIKQKSSGKQGRLSCPNCDYTYESTHASVLKQIFVHEYPDTIVEDKSFINPHTNCVMPTDIVNHRLKIAIEVQSQWHDFEDRKWRDEIKKNYWLNRGYKFYDPDIRDYTILEMCQLFFDLDELPDYLNYTLNKKLNLRYVQTLLNDGYSAAEIATKMNVGVHRIYNAIYDKKVQYPENYQNGGFVEIEQYDKDGHYLGVYPTITQAAIANNINPKTLISAMSKTRNCGGFKWKRKIKDIVKNP